MSFAFPAVAISAAIYEYTQDNWRWWTFVVAFIPCIIVAQFRMGMAAELKGLTNHAFARPDLMMFWSIIFGAFYAAFVTAAVGLLF